MRVRSLDARTLLGGVRVEAAHEPARRECVKVLLIDNYDSFTHNLYQLIGSLGARVRVARNDEIDVEGVSRFAPSHIVLSPGPGHPANDADFGVCEPVLRHFASRVPTLGVCLGHQGLARHFGAKVVKAPRVVHGKTSHLVHDGQGIFAGLPQDVPVMRYHSLAVDPATLSPELCVSARAREDDVIMALRHREWPLIGVQFHPESVGTPNGRHMVARFLMTRG